MQRSILAMALAAAGLWGAAQTAAAGTVTVITSFPKELTTAYQKAFEAANPGIKVEILNKNTTASVAYIRELPEGQRPDVMWASAPDAFEVLASYKLLQGAPEVVNRSAPEKIGNYPLNDPKGMYYGQALAGYGIEWNTRYLKAHKLPVPKEWSDLERLTKRGKRPQADDATSQGEQRDMNVDATLEAITQLAECGQPGVRALYDPAMSSESVVALDTSAGNTVLDAPTLEMGATARKVVALVRVQFAGPATRPAALACNRRQGINQLVEHHRVMTIGPGDAEHHRDALAIRDEVTFAAKFSPVRRVRACVRAPRGLGTLAPSMLKRLKSSLSTLRSSSSSARCRPCHTPAACQSRSRRQQVMPLPKPSSCGSSSHGMPVRSTNRTPFRAISSLTRGRPPLADGTNAGSSGSIFLNSAALISLFLFRPMHHQTHITRLSMTGLC